jgi:hypothetical protein
MRDAIEVILIAGGGALTILCTLLLGQSLDLHGANALPIYGLAFGPILFCLAPLSRLSRRITKLEALVPASKLIGKQRGLS